MWPVLDRASQPSAKRSLTLFHHTLVGKEAVSVPHDPHFYWVRFRNTERGLGSTWMSWEASSNRKPGLALNDLIEVIQESLAQDTASLIPQKERKLLWLKVQAYLIDNAQSKWTSVLLIFFLHLFVNLINLGQRKRTKPLSTRNPIISTFFAFSEFHRIQLQISTDVLYVHRWTIAFSEAGTI